MIPAGLIDKNIEFFSTEGQLFSIQDGVRYSWPCLPEDHIQFLATQLATDEAGWNSVQHLEPTERLKTYAICRFGGCNSTPDANADLDLQDSAEYFNCGLRGQCEWEGMRCKEIVADGGVISPRQLEIMKLVAEGLFNKEIAYKLSISEHTVANHIANIFDKMGDRSRVVITSFIKERGIL